MRFPLTSVERIQHLQQSVQTPLNLPLCIPSPYWLFSDTSSLLLSSLFFFYMSVNYRNWSLTAGWKIVNIQKMLQSAELVAKRKQWWTPWHTTSISWAPPQPFAPASISWQRAPLCCREVMWCPVPILWNQPSERGKGEGWIKTGKKKSSLFSELHSSTSVNTQI